MSAEINFGSPYIARFYGSSRDRWQDCAGTPVRWAGNNQAFVVFAVSKRIAVHGYRKTPRYYFGEVAVPLENLQPNKSQ